MLKLTMETETVPVYFLGLNAEEVARLAGGEPIQLHLAELGGHGDVIIIAAKTTAEVAKEIEHATGLKVPCPRE